jgi:hypothetical protein
VLEPALVHTALSLVIERHPALSVIIRREPSTTKKGSTRAWLAKLETIDLEECVSFLDNYDDSQPGMAQFFEDQHNTWFDTSSTTKPLWRVVVVNRRHAVFIWHHIICDGMGGVAFHRTLVSCLNEVARERRSPLDSLTINASKAPLQEPGTSTLQSKGFRPFLPAMIMLVLYLTLLHLLVPKKLWLFSDSASSRKPGSITKSPGRNVTKVRQLILEPATLIASLQFCKRHRITFATFLATLINITLATDIYPSARFGSIGTQVDVRRFLGRTPQQEIDDVFNCSGTVYYRRSTVPFRQSPPPSEASSSKTNNNAIPVDIGFFESNAARYSQHLTESMLPILPPRSPKVVSELLLVTTLPEDLEPFGNQFFPTAGAMFRGCWSFSNLGVFRPNPEPEGDEARWSVEDMQFSCATFEQSVSYDIYFALISTKGGACTISATFQDGTISEDTVERLLQRIEGRVLGLLEEEAKAVG